MPHHFTTGIELLHDYNLVIADLQETTKAMGMLDQVFLSHLLQNGNGAPLASCVSLLDF